MVVQHPLEDETEEETLCCNSQGHIWQKANMVLYYPLIWKTLELEEGVLCFYYSFFKMNSKWMNEFIFFYFYQGQKTNKIVNVVSNSCGAGRAKWTTLDFGGYERLGRILKCNFITKRKTEKLGYWFLIPHNENCKQVIRCDVIQSVLAILKETQQKWSTTNNVSILFTLIPGSLFTKLTANYYCCYYYGFVYFLKLI